MEQTVQNGTSRARRVLLVDDHPVVGVALGHVLGVTGGWVVLPTAGSPEEAICAVEREHPDAVVVDMMFPEDSGLRLLHWLRAHHPGMPVVVYSLQPSRVYGPRCIGAGAMAYVNKRCVPERVVDAIHQACAGVKTVDGERVAADPLRGSAGGNLSARELEVMNLLGQGLSNQRIAKLLSRSVKTIESHRYRISRKLGVQNGPPLIHLAIQHRMADGSGADGGG